MKKLSWRKGISFLLTAAMCLSVSLPAGGETAQAADVLTPDIYTSSVQSAAPQRSNPDAVVWDGSVDLRWYDPAESEYHLTTPAQLAGLAAIVNSKTSVEVTSDMIFGDTSFLENNVKDENHALTGAGGGNQMDTVYISNKENDFLGKTIYIDADMDMGGVYDEASGTWSGPNWTPIGGRFPMDIEHKEGDIFVIESAFNGRIEGNGHKISNLYCNRYTPKGFGQSHGVGFIGNLGDYEAYGEYPKNYAPAVRNLVLESGYVGGRRCVGGLIGSMGEDVLVENCANKAEVHGTDSSGIGGIAAGTDDGAVIRNCYNTGSITTSYATPAGGIVGASNGTDIYNCYSIGRLDAPYSRSIGSHGSGSYTVANCYYMEGLGDDENNGFYEGSAVSISVDVTAIPSAEGMQGPYFAGQLNANGKAFVAAEGEYPKLYFEEESYGSLIETTCKVTLAQDLANGRIAAFYIANGKLTALSSGTEVPYGTVVTLASEAGSGYMLESYTASGQKFGSNFYLVTGDTEFSADFKKLEKGTLASKEDGTYTLYVSKSGKFSQADGVLEEKNDVQVFPGETLYFGDVLTAIAILKKGAMPEDVDKEYTGEFQYTFAYGAGTAGTDGNSQNSRGVHTVTADIDESTVTVAAEAKTRDKLWTSLADTSWYDENPAGSEYTLSTPEELAGLAYLVNTKGITFEGKTVRLGSSISLKNNDGTTGRRFWDGIGNSSTKAFQGTFDGCGYTVDGMEAYNSGSYAGLFGFCADAEVKNLTVRGTSAAEKGRAGGIVAFASGTTITDCVNEVDVEAGSSGYGGGIAARLTGGSTVSGCINRGAVTGGLYVGGIAGEDSDTENTIENCSNSGTVTATAGGNTYAGGIAGRHAGVISGCINRGAVTSSGSYAGGISGYAERKGDVSASVTACASQGSVSAKDVAGGLVGFARNVIVKNCYNSGAVSVTAAGGDIKYGSAVGQLYRGVYTEVGGVFCLEGSCGRTYTTYNSDTGATVAEETLDYVSVQKKSESEMKAAAFVTELEKGGESGCYEAVPGGYPKLAWESGWKLYTVTFTGDYTGTKTVYAGGDITLPVPSAAGRAYTFNGTDGKEFTGKNITRDVSVVVTEEDAVCYVTFRVDGKTFARVEASKLAQDASAEPEVPQLAGYDGKWSDYRKDPDFGRADTAAYAEYTWKADMIVDGGQTLQSGQYWLAPNASDVITVAANADVTLDGSSIGHPNLSIVVEKGASLTLHDVVITARAKGLTLKDGSTLIAEGENKITGNGSASVVNEFPGISVEGNVVFKGNGVLSVVAAESCAGLHVAENCVFTQEGGTLKLLKTTRFSGTSGGVANAPKASIVVNGGIFSAVTYMDNNEGIFARSFTQNGGIVYAAALNNSVPLAIYTAEGGLHLNGGSLKAETRKHTTGDVGDDSEGTYHYNTEAIYSGTIEDKPAWTQAGLLVPSRPSTVEEMTPLSGYAFFAAYDVGQSAQVKVDGKDYYDGGTYPFGFDVEALEYKDSLADQSLYFYLKPDAKTITINGTDYAVSAGSNRPGGNPSDPSNPSDPVDTEKPEKPGEVTSFQLKSTAAATQKLTWKATPGASGYRIIRYSAKGKKQSTYTTKKTSLTVKNLEAATTYKYKINAYTKNSAGKTHGDKSKYLSVTTTPAKTSISKAVIKTSGSTAALTVKWKKVNGNGYQVQCSTDKKFNNKKNIQTYTANSKSRTSKKFGNLKKGTKYYVRVRAYCTLNKEVYYGAWSTVTQGK